MKSTRLARVALVVSSMVLIGIGAPMVANAAPPVGGMMPCPTAAELNSGFAKGLSGLVRDGDIQKGSAQSARKQFTKWVKANPGAGCDIRDGMMANGAEFMGFLGMTPWEIHDEYMAGKSMSEMAAENGISEEELIAFLEAQVDEGLDAFVAAGAFSTELRDAMDAKASETIAWGVDYHQGDPLPEGARSR